MELSTITRRSRAWYVLPILFGFIGGIIGYFAVRYDDPKMAKRLLILGVVFAAASVAVYIGSAVASQLI
jgi:hypothetical protein